MHWFDFGLGVFVGCCFGCWLAVMIIKDIKRCPVGMDTDLEDI